MLVGEENPSSEKFVHYDGIENAPGLIPRLIVTYTSPSQGKDHRDYTGYVSEAGPAPSSTCSDNNVVSDVLFFLGGVVFGGLVVSFMNYWRTKLQGKEKESEPGPTTPETDLQFTEQAVPA